MSTRRQPEKGHLGGIASKGFDIILHPFKQQGLVMKSQVEDVFIGGDAGRQKAERANAVDGSLSATTIDKRKAKPTGN